MSLRSISGVPYLANRSAGAALALQLQRSVGYMEIMGQVLIDCGHNFSTLAYSLVINEQVGAQGVYTRGDSPDVNIVYILHTGDVLIVSNTWFA